MDRATDKQEDTERLANLFIALVRESALLDKTNIQKARTYVRSLLEKQNGGKTSTLQASEPETPAEKPARSSLTLRCSFCGKPDSQVQRMIQGPGVCICDECVYLCLQVLLVPLD